MLEAQRSGFIFHLVRAKSERMWKEGRKQKSKDGGADEEDAARRIYCSLLIFRSATTSTVLAFFRLRICTNVQLPPQEFFLHLKKMSVK